MRWSTDPKPERQGWHKWFVWFPIRINNQVIWLEYVYRKAVIRTSHYGDWWEYEYNVEGQL